MNTKMKMAAAFFAGVTLTGVAHYAVEKQNDGIKKQEMACKGLKTYPDPLAVKGKAVVGFTDCGGDHKTLTLTYTREMTLDSFMKLDRENKEKGITLEKMNFLFN